jgi:tetratricopeptide (TPR) repeat protein
MVIRRPLRRPKASAETRLGNLADALKTFRITWRKILRSSSRRSLKPVSQASEGYSKMDDAITAYEVVRTSMRERLKPSKPTTGLGSALSRKATMRRPLSSWITFAKANPKNPLAPLALYAKGGALIALGKKEDGIATLATVAEQYPDSQPAPFTYFMRAQMLSSEGKADDVIGMMRQFIEKYPKDDKVYFAYESIAQTSINSGKADAGLATYREFVEKYPESPQAGDAMFKIAELQRTKAEGLDVTAHLASRAVAMEYAPGRQYRHFRNDQKYPDSASLALVLQTLLRSQRML